MMIRLFFALGIFWLLWGVVQFFALQGDPDRGKVLIQFLGMAAINLLVAWFLTWLRDRRERAQRP